MASEFWFGNGTMLALWGAGLLAKAASLLALVMTLIWFRRRASAASRHQVLALVAFSVLLLPLVSLLIPRWHLAWFPEVAARTTTFAAGATASVGEVSWLPAALAIVW